MTLSLSSFKRLLTSAAICAGMTMPAFAAPVTTFTFEFTVNSGTDSVGQVFQRTWVTGDFLTSPKYYDFGGGNGMTKAEARQGGAMSASPFEAQLKAMFPTLAPDGLDANLSNAELFAGTAYYTPGSPQVTTSQLQLESSNVKMHASGAGDYFYDNFQFFMWTYQSHEVEDLTPGDIADWWTDAGTVRWTEMASRAVCTTQNGPCTGREEVRWTGTATLLSAVTVDATAVPEPSTLPLLGLALAAVWTVRRRKA